MKKIILALMLSLVSIPSFAMTGFLQGQYIDGVDRHCVYNALGHRYDFNVGIDLCPLTVEV